MKAFRFRLQAVLDMRQREEDARSRELGTALKALSDENARLAELRMLEASALAEYHALQHAGQLDLQSIQWFQNYSMALTLSIREQLGRVAEAERRTETCRAVLMEAARAKQVLAELKAKAKEEHRRAEDREEAKTIDEIATLRHARKD